MSDALLRVAGAPITWGVCEVPGWGWQLTSERVLHEVSDLGLRAIELGPPGFLPGDPGEVARTLRGHDLRLAAGFFPAVLHRPESRAAMLQAIAAAAQSLAAAGADVLVLAAELGNGDGYDRSAELSDREWKALLQSLDEVQGAAARHGIPVALHPHYGTAVERRDHVERVVAESDVPLCLDTGHLLLGGTDPVEVVRAATGRVIHVHFKDVDAGVASRIRAGEIGYRAAVSQGLYQPLGDGDVDVMAVVRLLEAAGYDGWYVLEQDVVLAAEPPAGDGPKASAARSIDYLRRIIRG